MGRLKRILISILIASILCGLLPAFPPFVHAAIETRTINVDGFDSGTLNISWLPVSGVQSVVLSYHTPDPADQAVANEVYLEATHMASISGLRSDYIYDIEVSIFDAPNGTGNLIGRGFLYYLPKITFYATQLEQTRRDIPGGGVEIGYNPGLGLRWSIPKVFNGTDRFVHANTALSTMNSRIESVYGTDKHIATLNYLINISTDFNKLNGGPDRSSLLVNFDAGHAQYTADVSGGPLDDDKAVVAESNGYLSFQLFGKAEENAPIPEPGINPSDGLLFDEEILPGTVYYMNIKPIFKDSTGNNVYVVTAAGPEDGNGSLLTGPFAYTYTPIRFQLTKDAANNIYAKIFKINKGSLDLPRLYYQVQASDDSSIPGDWSIKKTIDDTYFSGDTAITVITGVNPNNLIYYKVVVKSDSPVDRLESPKLPYTLYLDTSRPPVPMGVMVIGRDFAVREEADGSTTKTTDITISWEKPANWDEIVANTDPDEDFVFHFLLNVAQTDMEISPYPPLIAEGKNYGNFPVRYRLVKYISARSPEITENGNRLEYMLKGFELFSGSHLADIEPIPVNPDDREFETVDLMEPDEVDANGNRYPQYLLPNKTYYLQMYTTKGRDPGMAIPGNISDKSVVAGFTTLSGAEQEVPLVKNFKVNLNEIGQDPSDSNSLANFIELQFERVKIDWAHFTPIVSQNHKIYYDLYMSTRTEADSFVLIGTTPNSLPPEDNIWLDQAQNEYVIATVCRFNSSSEAYTVFGEKLRPNTTYYFMVKTRLDIDGEDQDQESDPTAILSVTTLKGAIIPPGDDDRYPRAPVDFAIAMDDESNLLVTGTDVTFEWTKEEEGVAYELICTSERVDLEAVFSDFEDDLLYQRFKADYMDEDFDADVRVLTLDPDASVKVDGFSYDSKEALCRYELTNWLVPNKLYYFSLRAKLKSNGETSAWVSIPVTTLLIEKPSALQAVNDCEIGFHWTFSDAMALPEEFFVTLKGPSDSDYKQLTRSQFTIAKDGTDFYGRIFNLKPNTAYSVRVYRGTLSSAPVYTNAALITRDDYHQLEVKWQGKEGYEYEIAIKTDEDHDYILLDRNSGDYEIYTEKTPQTAGTNYSYYYARIKTVLTALPGGGIIRRPLKSNEKYYIKVRAKKIDPVDTTIISYSKYTGPVNTRTEFKQEDYDQVDQEEKSKAIFLDRVKELEEGLFWRVGMGRSSSNCILLKGERTINFLKNSYENELTIDISEFSRATGSDIIYVPVDVAKALKAYDRSFVIKTAEGVYSFRPDSLDPAKIPEMNSVLTRAGVKDLFVKITITRSTSASGLPKSSVVVSKVNELDVAAMGLSRTDKQLNDLFYERLYHAESGLVNHKLNVLLNSVYNGLKDPAALDRYVEELIGMIEKELSSHIDYEIRISVVSGAERQVPTFHDAVGVYLPYTPEKGLKVPYALYDTGNGWRKLTDDAVESAGSLFFNVSGTGKYVLLVVQGGFSDVPQGYWAKEYIDRFTSRYDLTGVFAGIGQSFSPEDHVNGRELVLLYEIVMEKAAENTGKDIKQKAKSLGLDEILNMNAVMRAITKEETSGVVMQLYASKMGIDGSSLISRRNIYIKDVRDIAKNLYRPVILSIDFGIMETDAGGYFLPDAFMSRADVIAAFVKTLELTGDM